MEKGNKKNLVILLLAPFLAGLLTYVSVTILKNTIGVDISDIRWDYEENEGYQLSGDPYALLATPVYDEKAHLSAGNELVWRVDNSDSASEPHAEILSPSAGVYQLKTLSLGNISLTCANAKGSKSKHFNAEIYDQGYIRINTALASSGSSHNALRRFGQYDMVYSSLSSPLSSRNARIPLHIEGAYDGDSVGVSVLSSSANLSFSDNTIEILSPGEAHLTFALADHPFISKDYAFVALEDCYNVYTYDDLLKGTNLSATGERLCLQTSFDSLKNTYAQDGGKYVNSLLDKNRALFGHFDFTKQECDFTSEIYRFPTTYSHSYIDTYNAAVPGANVSSDVLAGLHVQKSLYGNGFLINMHELCYPTHGSVGTDGLRHPDSAKDYFFGPLPLVSIGAPSQPVVEAYGQDNCGVYLDGDGITLEDISLRNSNSDLDNLYDLSFAGTVVDVEGNNNTISYSSLSYGRSIVRAYSSPNLKLSHCLLSTSREFLLHVGSNTLAAPNPNQQVRIPYGSTTIADSFTNFYNPLNGGANQADGILNDFTMNGVGSYGVSGRTSTLDAIQHYLDNSASFEEKGETRYEDEIYLDSVYFHRSGLFSIALDAAFNGPYLYNGLPSIISSKLGSYLKLIAPNQVGATSAPVRVHLRGDTRFYDWKDISTVDPSSLITNNLASLTGSTTLTTDNFFPMKPLLSEAAQKAGLIYSAEGMNYLNTQVAYYGGGLNLSTLVDERTSPQDPSSSILEISFLKASLENRYVPEQNALKILARCVSLAMGFHSFRFLVNATPGSGVPAYFGESPSFAALLAS
jgi:hypothetical protein